MIARADENQRGQWPSFLAPAKNALVESDQKRVKNGAVRVQQFIEKYQRSLRQHAFGIGEQFAIAKLSDVEWTKQFIWLGESGQQVIECASFKARGEIMH